MSSELAPHIAALYSSDSRKRAEAAAFIYSQGFLRARPFIKSWLLDTAFAALIRVPEPAVTVGLAVQPNTFTLIRAANGSPELSVVPPYQDAQEFTIQFANDVTLDILTSGQPDSPTGAIAKFLRKSGEGIQQVEFECSDVDMAAARLHLAFGISPVYPRARAGADHTKINFFLVKSVESGSVLIELYQKSQI